jgi:hypothetical protein
VRTRGDLVEARTAATNQLAALLDAHWAFCAEQGYSGRKPATVLLARLRSAPAGALDPVVSEGIRDAVLAHIGVLAAQHVHGGVVEPLLDGVGIPVDLKTEVDLPCHVRAVVPEQGEPFVNHGCSPFLGAGRRCPAARPGTAR